MDDGLGKADTNVSSKKGGTTGRAAPSPLTAAQQALSTGGSFIHIPVTLGAVAMSYNLSGISGHLNLTPDIIAVSKAVANGLPMGLTLMTEAVATQVPPGTLKDFPLGETRVLVANVGGEFYAVRDVCPGSMAPLHLGSFTPPVLVCPWHNEAYDIRTGKSWCDPRSVRVRNFPVTIEPGARLVEGPYVAETFPVSVEDQYVVVEM